MLDVAGKRTFIRADFNVPLENGRITDATRIEAALPTIKWAVAHGARVILASHLGRPKGKRDPKYSLQPVGDALAELLHLKLILAPDCVGPEIERMSKSLDRREILLLENLRFHPEEEANDPAFARQLAALADGYVNDAFGAAHRAHASTEGMAHVVPVTAAGFLMQKEVDALAKIVDAPERPVVAILGGAKVSDKIKVIEHLLDKVDMVLIGGAVAYTFLLAAGRKIGDSVVGGGDSIAALARSGRSDDITHISTGGRSALEFLEGRPLPGLTALER